MRPTSALRWGGAVALYLGALLYFRLGLHLPLEWIDEGMIVYPSWRVAHGATPYVDFLNLYGPSVFFWNAGLLRLFGEDLWVIRLGLAAVKALCALLVYLCTRQLCSRSFALGAYAGVLALWGLPWPALTTPYANHFGLTLDLAGLLLVLRAPARAGRALFAAGLCFGAAATFKQTSGIFAVVAVGLFLLWDAQHGAAALPRPAEPGRLRGLYALLPLGAVALFGLYMARAVDAWTLLVLWLPAAALCGWLAWRGVRRGCPPERAASLLGGLASLGAGAALPAALYAGYYAWLGGAALRALGFNALWGLPRAFAWFVAFPAPSVRVALWGLGLIGLFGALRSQRRARWYLALALAAGAALLVDAWQPGRNRDWWFWGVSDPLMWLPLLVVWLSLRELVLRADAPGAADAELRGLALFGCFGAVALLFLYPSGDVWHVLHAAPAFLPLGAQRLEVFRERGAPARRWLRTAACLGVALTLCLPGLRDLLVHRASRQGEPGGFARASHIVGPAPFAPYSSELVAALERRTPRDQPLFVVSGKALLYFLSDRLSPVEEQEFGLYLAALGFLSDFGVRALVDEDVVLARLRESQPLVVDDRYDEGGQRVRRLLPRVAAYLDAHYRLVERFGLFELWAPRSGRTPR